LALSLIATALFVSKSDNFDRGCQKFNPIEYEDSDTSRWLGRSMNQIEIEALIKFGFGKKRDKQQQPEAADFLAVLRPAGDCRAFLPGGRRKNLFCNMIHRLRQF